MTLLRCIAYLLPQVLILLFLGGSRDLLGGWNQTDDALVTLLALFVLSPSLALTLLVIEVVRCWKNRYEQRVRAALFIGLAILFLIEAIAIDVYLLTQVRM